MKRGSLLTGLLAGVYLSAAWTASAASQKRYALRGAEAAAFQLPSDMALVRTLPMRADRLSWERYQQRFESAAVLGAQLTFLRDASGQPVAVIGRRSLGIAPSNAVRLTAAQAREVAAADVGAGTTTAQLLIDPRGGRYFYRVETRRAFERWFHWVDADTGRVLRKYDGRETGDGIGVKGDVKSFNGLDGVPGTADDISRFHNGAGHGAPGPHWDLFSADDRQKTYDAHNGTLFADEVTDADNHWTLVTPDRTSPGQPAMVDAQYYAQVTDGYYLGRQGLDWVADCGYPDMTAVVHYDFDYVNAFWGGSYMVYGDGDGFIAREFSGALDVVAHELSHGVTQCTSNLIYQDESGALNESFSDVLGSSAEFWADQNGFDPSVTPDWFIGEDIFLFGENGFRNMADPSENGDPDHYSERYVGPEDNGGVHTNSLIPNHAYYLLVNGGSNAGEAWGHGHTGPVVTAIGLAAAERIFFLAFTSLTEDAVMCDARSATEATAAALYGAGSQEELSTRDAWLAVGVTNVACGLEPPAAPTDLTAAAVSSSRIELAWTDNSSDEDGFAIERSTDGVTFVEVAVLGTDEETYTATGLTEQTSYSFRVRAFGGPAPMYSGYTNVASATTLPAPAAPSALTATPVSSGRINLAWTDNATYEQGFKIERSTEGGPFVEIASVGANVTAYANTGLAGSTTYAYRVRAYENPNVSGYSNTATATTFPVPAAPSNLTATAVSSSRINLAWTDNSTNEIGFKVERSTDGATFSLLVTLGANAVSYADTNLAASTQFFYRVRATDGANDSAPSNTASATTHPPPAPPTNLTATAVSPSQINLAWTDNSNVEEGFRVERSTGGGSFVLVTLLGPNTTAYSNLFLTAATTYSFRVRAFEGPNASAPSNTATATTQGIPAAPSNLVAAAVSSARIDLTWTDNATGEGGFKVERSSGGGAFGVVANVGANATSFSDLNLPSATTFTYRVRAVEGLNSSEPSNPASATTLSPPAAPSGLAAVAVTSTRIDLSWTDNSTYEQGYRVERSSGGGAYAVVGLLGANATAYSSTSLVSGTTYSYRVRAYEGPNQSGYSNTVSASPLPPPAAPSNLVATAVSPSQINLTWTDNATYEQGFKIERSSDGISFTQIGVLGVNAVAYSAFGLVSGTHTFRVRAYEGANDSPYSNTATANTAAAPAAPSNLTATPVSSSRIDLAWVDNSSNEQGFKVERSTDGVSFAQVAAVGPNVTTYANTGVVTGVTYTYRVKSYNGPNDSAPSNTATATPLAGPPAPTNLVATAVSASRIDLAWTDNAASEQGYKVERSTDGVTFTQIAVLGANATSYASTGLVATTTYTHRVRAYDGPNESAYSNLAVATTLGPPAVPSNLTATPVSSSRINLAWTDNASNEDGFKVERATGGGAFSVVTILGPNATTYANTNLSSGTYTYRVRSFTGPNESAPSATATATTLPVPAAPTGLSATPQASSRIDLSWTDNSTTEQGFRIERSADGVTFTPHTSVGANATTFSFTALVANTTYAFRVKAFDGPNDSGPSNIASATTLPPPPAPSALVATAVSSTRIDLHWTDNSGYEQGYTVERATGGGSFVLVAALGANATAFSSTGLAPGTSYSFRVRCSDSPNYSAYSNTASATTP
jgi:Zn-dependent metalloprotease/transcriptional regulator CtsR